MSEIEFLQLKGIPKVHQPNKRYNLSIAEMIEFLQEYSKIKLWEKNTRFVEMNNNEKMVRVS